MDPLINHLASDKRAQLTEIPVTQLAKHVQVGDLIFIRVTAALFKAVANATGTWTNHVGVVTRVDGDEPHIGESSFPFSRTTTLSKFVARSERGRVAVARLKSALTPEQAKQIQLAVHRRNGILYDTGFNLYSKRQFCSRYAHEILNEATGIAVGKIQTLREVVANQPTSKLGFWELWYFGKIPWERKTVTPVSLLHSPELHTVFYGNAITQRRTVRDIAKQFIIKPIRALFKQR